MQWTTHYIHEQTKGFVGRSMKKSYLQLDMIRNKILCIHQHVIIFITSYFDLITACQMNLQDMTKWDILWVNILDRNPHFFLDGCFGQILFLSVFWQCFWHDQLYLFSKNLIQHGKVPWLHIYNHILVNGKEYGSNMNIQGKLIGLKI